MQEYWAEIETPVGTLWLYATDEALVRVDSHGPRPQGKANANTVLREAARQLEEYFAGRRTKFDLPLAPEGTDFQKKVWRAMQRIPYGQTESYGHLAHGVQSPAASRAVGAACGRNPLLIVIPCHRVVGADGSLTGFGGGLAMKEWLLEHEGNVFKV